MAKPAALSVFDDMLYTMAAWAVLVPKTCWKVLRHPSALRTIVLGELQKPEPAQFDSFASPVMFFLLLGICPMISSMLVGKRFSLAGRSFNLQSLSFASLVITVGVLAIIPPLTFAFFLLRTNGEHFGVKAFQPWFYVQCLYFGMFYFLLYLSLFLWGASELLTHPFGFALQTAWSWRSLLSWHSLGFPLSLCWFFYAEVCIFQQVIESSWPRAITTALCAGLSASLVFTVSFLVYVIVLDVVARATRDEGRKALALVNKDGRLSAVGTYYDAGDGRNRELEISDVFSGYQSILRRPSEHEEFWTSCTIASEGNVGQEEGGYTVQRLYFEAEKPELFLAVKEDQSGLSWLLEPGVLAPNKMQLLLMDRNPSTDLVLTSRDWAWFGLKPAE